MRREVSAARKLLIVFLDSWSRKLPISQAHALLLYQMPSSPSEAKGRPYIRRSRGDGSSRGTETLAPPDSVCHGEVVTHLAEALYVQWCLNHVLRRCLQLALSFHVTSCLSSSDSLENPQPPALSIMILSSRLLQGTNHRLF